MDDAQPKPAPSAPKGLAEQVAGAVVGGVAAAAVGALVGKVGGSGAAGSVPAQGEDAAPVPAQE